MCHSSTHRQLLARPVTSTVVVGRTLILFPVTSSLESASAVAMGLQEDVALRMAGQQVALLLGASCNAHGAVENPQQHPLCPQPLSPNPHDSLHCDIFPYCLFLPPLLR